MRVLHFHVLYNSELFCINCCIDLCLTLRCVEFCNTLRKQHIDWFSYLWLDIFKQTILRENCPYTDQKKLHIWTLFTQCKLQTSSTGIYVAGRSVNLCFSSSTALNYLSVCEARIQHSTDIWLGFSTFTNFIFIMILIKI